MFGVISTKRGRPQSAAAEDPHAPVWLPGTAPGLAGLAVPSHPVFDRLLMQIPLGVRQSFTPEQLTALSRATIPVTARHPLDYRVSLPFFGRRYYLTVLGGRERRSRERLLREGQAMLSRMTLAYSFLVGTAAGFALFVAIVVLYIVKSLLGIDLIEGESALHDIFELIWL